jgi:hypothetical protein
MNALLASAALEEDLAVVESYVERGDLVLARSSLQRIIDVYDGNTEVATLVERARIQLRELDSGASEAE